MDRDAFDVALIPGMRERLAETYVRFRSTLEAFQQAESRVASRIATRERCPACAHPSADAESLFVSRSLTHVRCRQCGLVYTLQVLEAADDQALYQPNSAMQAYFTLKESPDYAWLESRKAEYLAGQARRHCAAGSTFLDVGCSTGRLLAAARTSGFDVYGLEANPDMVAQAQQAFGDRAVQGYFPAAVPAGWPAFQVIAILDLLEHMVEPLAFLAQLAQRLAPGGMLLIQVPNHDSLIVQLEGSASSTYCHGHWLHFDGRTLSGLLDRAGFDALWQETIISELDRVRAMPPGQVLAALERLAPGHAGGLETLDAQALHRHLLGYKLVGIYRKR